MQRTQKKIINLLKKKNLSENTINLYLKTFKQLCDGHCKNLKFLKNVDDNIEKIKHYKLSTKASIIGRLVSLCDINPKLFAKTQKKYRDHMKTLFEELNNEKSNGKRTAKQKLNWIEWKDVISKRDELANTNNLNYNQILQYILLCIFTYIPPRRSSDYNNMIMTTKSDLNSLDKTKNWYCIGTGEMLFNTFKTHNKYGDQSFDIDEKNPLFNILKKWYEKSPCEEEDKYLLCRQNGLQFRGNNTTTKMLNDAFYPKKVGSSMLRHSYLTNEFNLGQMQKRANMMGHSLTTQLKNYIKDKSVDNEDDKEEHEEHEIKDDDE